jgi:hypothetical protein
MWIHLGKCIRGSMTSILTRLSFVRFTTTVSDRTADIKRRKGEVGHGLFLPKAEDHT